MQQFIKTRLMPGLKTPPSQHILLTTGLFLGFAVIASVIGFSQGLLSVNPLASSMIVILPLTLFVFPSLLEEIVFRGLLIPNNTRALGRRSIIYRSLLSSIMFVVWHPLNALTINPGAKFFFLDPYFLLIVFFLGMTCSLGYIYSRSLWVPVIMHWLTVLIWVLLLGGRNLIL